MQDEKYSTNSIHPQVGCQTSCLKFRIICFLPCCKLFTCDTFMLVLPLYTLKKKSLNQLENKSLDMTRIPKTALHRMLPGKRELVGQKPPVIELT